MQHPVHGCKMAIAEVEAIADEKLGWIRVKEPEPAQEITDPVAEQAEVEQAEVTDVAETPRRGRK
jgi:hypothetical protein